MWKIMCLFYMYKFCYLKLFCFPSGFKYAPVSDNSSSVSTGNPYFWHKYWKLSNTVFYFMNYDFNQVHLPGYILEIWKWLYYREHSK
jgi:hypothetical protein